MKNFIKTRIHQLTTWAGFIGLALEFFLHAGNISLLIVIFNFCLIFFSDESFKKFTAGKAKKIDDSL